MEWANLRRKQACKNSSTVPNGQLTGSSWRSPHPESQLQGVQFPHWGSDRGKVYRRSLGQVCTTASSPSGAGWVRDKQRGQCDIWRVANGSTSWPKLSISASPLRVKHPFPGPQPLPRQDPGEWRPLKTLLVRGGLTTLTESSLLEWRPQHDDSLYWEEACYAPYTRYRTTNGDLSGLVDRGEGGHSWPLPNRWEMHPSLALHGDRSSQHQALRQRPRVSSTCQRHVGIAAWP